MAKHLKKRATPWEGSGHDEILLKQIDLYPTSYNYAFQEASRIIKEKYGVKRSPGACSQRYYHVLSNPSHVENKMSTLPVVVSKQGNMTRARRITKVISTPGINDNAKQVLKKIISRLSAEQREQLTDMLVFGDF